MQVEGLLQRARVAEEEALKAAQGGEARAAAPGYRPGFQVDAHSSIYPSISMSASFASSAFLIVLCVHALNGLVGLRLPPRSNRTTSRAWASSRTGGP